MKKLFLVLSIVVISSILFAKSFEPSLTKTRANWTIHFLHEDDTPGTCVIAGYDGFGVGNSGTTPHVSCSCGSRHTFTGSQSSPTFAHGSGLGSVAPDNDHSNKSVAKALSGPSWGAEITD